MSLTGSDPGNTAQAVLGKIIAGKPVSAAEQRPAIPANVDAALRKALEKLPADRFTSAQDFVRALGDEHFRYGEVVAGVGGAAGGPWKRLAIAFATLAAVTTFGFGWTLLRPEPPPSVTRISVRLSADQGFRPSGGVFDISSDGSLMVYRGDGDGVSQLWARRWDALDATPIRDTDGARLPAVSPDGREVAIATSGLRVVPIGGGVSRTLIDSVRGNVGVRWSHDGVWVYYTNMAYGLSRVPSGGGSPEIVTQVDTAAGDLEHWGVDVLPRGRAVVYTESLAGGLDARIKVLNMDTGEVDDLAPGMFPRYSTSGHLLFKDADGATLLAAPFDVEKLEVTGAAIPVADGLMVAQGWPIFAVSQTGTLLYSTRGSEEASDTELVWVTRSGVATPVDAGWQFNRGGGNSGWSLSPDGRRVALRIGTQGNNDIWIKQLPEGPLERLTLTQGQEAVPWWTPDGQTVMYFEPHTRVWSKRVDGTGDAELVLDAGQSFAQGLWSPDGDWLVLRTSGAVAQRATGDRDVWALRPSVDSLPFPLVATEWAEQGPALSPDGRWLAYSSEETGRHEVFVLSFPEVDSPRVRISTDGGRRPVWAHSGRELFFLDPNNALVAVQIETTPGFRVVEQQTLFTVPPEYYDDEGTDFYDVSLDDQRFLMGRGLGLTAESQNLIMVTNFFEELKRLVPN